MLKKYCGGLFVPLAPPPRLCLLLLQHDILYPQLTPSAYRSVALANNLNLLRVLVLTEVSETRSRTANSLDSWSRYANNQCYFYSLLPHSEIKSATSTGRQTPKIKSVGT
jgi:hypothetical protein